MKTLITQLCSGFGQQYTTNPKYKGLSFYHETYASITLDQIYKMAENPQSVPKDSKFAQWVIPSMLHSRANAEQLERGSFFALWGDLDKNPPSMDALVGVMDEIVSGANCLLYNTRSATPDKPKARILIPLETPCSGTEFIRLQKILNNRLEKAGITPDRKNESANQLCYLPNRGEFYDYQIVDGGLFDWNLWSDDIAVIVESERIAEEERTKKREQARLKAVSMIAARTHNVMEAFNAAYDLQTCLEMFGYERRGDKWLSPNSESGNAGVSINKDGTKWFSHHSSDSGIGRSGKDGGTWGDAFDLFKYYEHGNDERAALKAAGNMFEVDGVTIEKANQRNYMERTNSGPTFNRAGGGIDPISFVSLETISSMEIEERPIASGFLYEGEPLLIHATGGIGKSLLTLDIALKLASVTEFKILVQSLWGKFHIPKQRRTIFIQSENSMGSIHRRVKKMTAGTPEYQSGLKNIFFPKMRDDILCIGEGFEDSKFRDSMESIIQTIEDQSGKLDIMVIDPLISFIQCDENDNSKMRKGLDTFTKFCYDRDITPIIVHHDNKSGGYRGASAIFDWARNIIGLKESWGQIEIAGETGMQKVRQITVNHEKSNNFEQFPEFILRPTRNLKFVEVGDDKGLPEKVAKRCKDVVQALRDAGGATNQKTLIEQYMSFAAVSRATAQNHIREASEKKYVAKQQDESDSRNYVFTLPEN